MRFKLEFKDVDRTVTLEHDAVGLEEFFEYCKNFLNGVGYRVDNIEFNTENDFENEEE